MREGDLKCAGAVERSPTAGIPRREAHEPIEQAKRNTEGKGFHPRESAGNRQQVNEHCGERKPAQQVSDEPSELAENWVHFRGLVFDFQAAEDSDAADDQLLGWRVGWRMAGLVAVAAKNSHAIDYYVPSA